MKRLLGFDFSAELLNRREAILKNGIHHRFKIFLEQNNIVFFAGR